MNKALDRIKTIKAKSGSGRGTSFTETDPFINPIILQAAEEVKAETTSQEPLPPLEEDQDEARVAMRLIALQAEGVGTIAPTRTAVYNNVDGTVDKIISELEDMQRKQDEHNRF